MYLYFRWTPPDPNFDRAYETQKSIMGFDVTLDVFQVVENSGLGYIYVGNLQWALWPSLQTVTISFDKVQSTNEGKYFKIFFKI